MTKAEFITLLAAKNTSSKAEAEKILAAFLDAVEDGLVKDNRVTLRGFGNFIVKTRAKHLAYNISTGNPVEIPDTKVIIFKPAQKFLKFFN